MAPDGTGADATFPADGPGAPSSTDGTDLPPRDEMSPGLAGMDREASRPDASPRDDGGTGLASGHAGMDDGASPPGGDALSPGDRDEADLSEGWGRTPKAGGR